VVVIADNCDDGTAPAAGAAGARVLERRDPERRGKGYALDFAFRTLLAEDYAGFAVIDADTLADANFLSSVRRHLGSGSQVVQARYTVLNGSASPRTALAELALAAFNVLRPRGRVRMGWSAGILGNGFALRRTALEQVPYTATSVVEDLEYHLQLIDAGIRVGFADDTTVRGDMPSAARGADTQRARWEGGRLRMLREHSPALAGLILSGRLRYLEPLADLLLLPLGYHVIALLAATLLGAALGAGPGLVLAATGLAVVATHVLVALRVGGLPWRRLLILARVPAYLLWKLRMVGAIATTARRNSAWVRTTRGGD
jgi:cellulose synthase/poly-beta-1,6-N-acetylglucosamine synthase-like glycosyltransferase